MIHTCPAVAWNRAMTNKVAALALFATLAASGASPAALATSVQDLANSCRVLLRIQESGKAATEPELISVTGCIVRSCPLHAFCEVAAWESS